MYNECNTSYDVMKEFLIQGAELCGEYGFPMLPKCRLEYMPIDSVDFAASFDHKIKNHRHLNVNFYIDDIKFTRIWNNTDKYLPHLKCFNSVMSPDFSIVSGMPLALNIYNKYRNHALAWYMHISGIDVVPSISVAGKEYWRWCFDGYPKNSLVSVCTNGRVRSKAARMEFCEGFYEMCERLEPSKVIIIGNIPDELNTDVELVHFMSRNQRINKEMRKK